MHSIVFHFDIKEGKIWLQANWIEVDVAEWLVERGVPKEDIVPGFQPPYARPYSGYAVA
ncbi:MAG: XisI protein [Lewinellaceae bacterium]|nr:XisI protein [Lewinellaceae bacterium]